MERKHLYGSEETAGGKSDKMEELVDLAHGGGHRTQVR